MGQTLENGVYLPSEGERNCYAGLKTNWEILDQKVADVTALQQAVAGALHREIVESLPTTDIDPNTIYMILSGTSATENVYNEYMYVNNAWELIGTSATDLTNYYTKSDVDGKLLLKANASDLTSHTGDTTIHVTTADKNKWNNQTYVFRYSSTALTPSSTNSNTLLDNTDNLKVGDKVIDSSGVLFSITAIDTQNSTFTIGTALIDLANDSDVVHKSGDETVGGVKRFTDDIIKGSVNTNSTIQARNLIGKTTASTTGSDSNSYQSITATLNYSDSTPSKSVSVSLYVTETAYSDGRYSAFRSNSNNTTNLGTSEKKWANVYATNYYYGSNSVEFSNKFVTTDTNQTISGSKTFTDNISLKSLTAEYTVTGAGISVTYSDKNGLLLAQNKLGNYQSGISYNKFSIFAYDSNNQLIDRTLSYSSANSTLATAYFRPDNDNIVSLGTAGNRWSKVYATNYYYGNDNIEFSTKFITTDTAQTISGNKTFSSDLSISNTDTTANTPNLNLRNYKVDRGTTDTGAQAINFLDKNAKALTSIESRRVSNGNTAINILCYNTDDSNNTVSGGIAIIKSKNDTIFAPNTDNAVNCGRALAKWSDVVTYKVNGVEPSSLSLPSGNANNVIDISSYITALDGTSNSYTVPANGWISIAITGTAIAIVSSSWSDSRLRESSGNVRMLYPVLKNETLGISVMGTTLAYARFIPCQGNV